MIDWVALFTDYRIDYVTRGPNTKKGEVSVCCPFCGDDPSFHLGVSLTDEKWGCWRSASHAGKKPHNLIKGLLGCSYTQARLIADQYSHSDPESLDDAIRLLSASDKPDKARATTLHMPTDFKRIVKTGMRRRFWKYLRNRGFSHVDELTDFYNLRCCMTGPWKDRIIFPIYRDGELVCWVGRALQNPISAPRYRALSLEEGAIYPTTDLLFNEDDIRDGGDVLFIVEGPFDALKMDFYSPSDSIRTTCTFGTHVSLEQISIIGDLSRQFNRTILLYDKGATEAIFGAEDLLAPYRIEVGSLPDDIEDDPGSMTPREIRQLIKNYI